MAKVTEDRDTDLRKQWIMFRDFTFISNPVEQNFQIIYLHVCAISSLSTII